ncbi:MAG: preprotein translocase subunit SecE [Bacteroidia bacterium]
MSKFKEYIDETVNELVQKVSWPSWKELQNKSVIVMVAAVIMSLAIFVMDFSFNKMMEFIYQTLG